MQIPVSLSLILDVPDAEAQKYYLNTDGTPALPFTADMFDILGSYTDDPLVTVNGMTHRTPRGKVVVDPM